LPCSIYRKHKPSNRQRSKALSQKEKIADFDSLYNTLRRVYPYFEINKRQYGIDWLGNYENYKRRLIETRGNKEYIAELQSIVYELNCDHTDLMPTKDYKYFFKAYRRFALFSGAMRNGLKELKKSGAKKKHTYWSKLLKEAEFEKYGDRSFDSSLAAKADLSAEFDSINSIARISIPSFSYDVLKKDKSELAEFFGKIAGYDKLIIDIQGNSGGMDRYWASFIVPHILKKEQISTNYIAYKEDPLFYDFYTGSIRNVELKDIELANMPKELKSGGYKFHKREFSYYPKNEDEVYKGKVFLLVDDIVFSAAEGFAVFCKQCDDITVVGEQTAGDGIGSNPFLFTLPKSGIVMRYTGEMGLNADGSANMEMRTIPDIELKGETKDERLQELIDMLKRGEV